MFILFFLPFVDNEKKLLTIYWDGVVASFNKDTIGTETCIYEGDSNILIK